MAMTLSPRTATLDEIAAAVKGTLGPRPVPGPRDAAGSMRRPLGVTTGLPIQMAWCFIFQKNERNPRDAKLTDAQVTDWMRSEFPDRMTGYFANVSYARKIYNVGGWTKNAVPRIVSHEYDRRGATVAPRKRGRPRNVLRDMQDAAETEELVRDNAALAGRIKAVAKRKLTRKK